MGKIRSPGLFKRGKTWHIDKQVDGCRLRESTGASDLFEAERYLAKRTEEIRQATVYGVRPVRVFREAATKFLSENQSKASLRDDVYALRVLDPFIGKLPLKAVHMGSLQAYIEARKKDGVKNRTINYGLQVTRRILNLAAGLWLDEHGLTWLDAAPKIVLLSEKDKRKPYPISWDEQGRLFKELPPYLQQMVLFAVNTGCRDQEVCKLRWEWEIRTNIDNRFVFIIPGIHIKNREDRLVVLNDIAMKVVEERRGIHSEYVFTYEGKPITHMCTSAWRRARERVGLDHVRIHDLRHTFGRRLRAAGVSLEDREDLLGHKSGRMTTHYSAVEVKRLMEAANKICTAGDESPTLLILRQNGYTDFKLHNSPGADFVARSTFAKEEEARLQPHNFPTVS